MKEKVVSVLKKYNMLKFGDRIVIGVSGGADSVALLSVLNDLRKEMGLALFVVHVNHLIRGDEAERDEEFVKKLCASLNIKCWVMKYDVPLLAKTWSMTEEEAGRKVRYDAFEEYLKKNGAAKIAVAHNLNDQAETVIMRLCRGSGLTGLSGIPPTRDNIIRPLIECSREEIENWLKKENIEFCTDSSNLETDYTRNKIRLKVLPYLVKEINLMTVQNIAKTASIVKEEDEYIQEEAERAYGFALCRQTASEVILKITEISNFSKAIQRRIIRRAFKSIDKDFKDITFSHIEAVLELLDGQSGKKINLSREFIAEKEYNLLRIKKGVDEKQEGFCYNLIEDEVVFIKEVGLFVKMTKKSDSCKKNEDLIYTKCFDYDKINDVLKVRTRKATDSMSINKNGGNKEVKNFFTDEKVPRKLREMIPLVVFDNKVLWIIGYRSAAYYEANDETKNVLYVQAWEATND